MTCCYKTSSLQAFIPIPELCGNVAKVKSTFFSAFTLPTISQPSDAGAAASTEPPHIYVHFEDRHPERSQWYDINSVYAVNFINFNKKIRTFSVHAIYQLFAQMLSRPDNTVPNWQKVRAVHLNMKVSCFFSARTNIFFVPSESEPSKVGYKSHPNSLWWEQSSSGEHNNCFRRMDLSLRNDMYSPQAPAGCGRYFTANSGNISSLNWKDGTYLKWEPLHSLNTFHNLFNPRNSNIASCIKPDLGACAIQYNLKG